jgi:hypothetical protein
MSALLQDDLPWASPRYQSGMATVPTPAGLRAYVRDDRHFTLILARLTSAVGGSGNWQTRFSGDRLRCGQQVLRLLRDGSPRADGRPAGLNDPLAHELLRLLFPPRRCAICGAPFLPTGARREFCSERCRRMCDNPNHGTGKPLPPQLDACAVCGGALRGKQRRYCGAGCKRRGRHLKEEGGA